MIAIRLFTFNRYQVRGGIIQMDEITKITEWQIVKLNSNNKVIVMARSKEFTSLAKPRKIAKQLAKELNLSYYEKKHK